MAPTMKPMMPYRRKLTGKIMRKMKMALTLTLRDLLTSPKTVGANKLFSVMIKRSKISKTRPGSSLFKTCKTTINCAQKRPWKPQSSGVRSETETKRVLMTTWKTWTNMNDVNLKGSKNESK